MSFKNAAGAVREDSGQQFESLNSIVQWINGRTQFAPLGNTAVAFTGGFAVLHDRIVGDTRKTGWPEQMVTIGNKNQKAIVAPRYHFAVIAARSRWEETEGDGGTKGTTRRIQVLAMPRGCHDPVIITIAGHAQIGMQDALRQLQSKVLNPAGQLAGLAYPYPSYAFWLDVSTSGHKMVGKQQGKQSEVTAPAIILPDFNGDQALLEKYLEDMFVGEEELKRFEILYKQAQLWAAQWNDKDKPAEKTSDGETKPEGTAAASQQTPGQPAFAQPEFAAAYQMQAPPPPMPAPQSQPEVAPAPSFAPAQGIPGQQAIPAQTAPVSNVTQFPGTSAAAPVMPQAQPAISVLPSNWATMPPAGQGTTVGEVADQGGSGFKPPF